MKTKTITAVLISACLSSCVVPEGTPAQKARQTEANAKLGNAVAMGVAATLFGVAANKIADNHRPHYYTPHYYRRGYIVPSYLVY